MQSFLSFFSSVKRRGYAYSKVLVLAMLVVVLAGGALMPWTPHASAATLCRYGTYQKGSNATCVSHMQTLLDGLVATGYMKLLASSAMEQSSSGRYYLTVDGNFGKATEVGVRKFQASAGLTVDGVAGKNTWGSLCNWASKKGLSTNKTMPPISHNGGVRYMDAYIAACGNSKGAIYDVLSGTARSSTPLPPKEYLLLAKGILNNPRIDLGCSTSESTGDIPKTDIIAASKGKPATNGVMVDIRVLEAIAVAGRKGSVCVSSIQNHGQGHATNSMHYKGMGVDFNYYNGVHLSGRDVQSRTLMVTIMNDPKLAPQNGHVGRFAQGDCGGAYLLPLPTTWTTYSGDTCDHLHVDFGPSSGSPKTSF